MDEELATKFQELFTGSETAYGEWIQSRQPPASTKHVKPGKAQYLAHLNGTVGLGIVPVNSEGLCRFGAIDIDIDTIDHALLFKIVTSHKLQLSVCRSKSGGAHLYFFTKEIHAQQVQNILTQWATLLGYPTAEIFPKQKATSASNAGSWINLPYFGGDTTTRYAVGEQGAMTLQEFVDSVQLYNPDKKEPVVTTRPGSEMPPCLAHLTENGITEGHRNAALFNFAVFYRKSSPATWETMTAQQNSQYFNPPLDHREMSGIITSASRNKYQYTCEQSPLKDFCNREYCIKLPFGVGHMPWQEQGSFDDLIVKSCRKLLTDPPKYVIEVNGYDVVFSWEEFYQFGKFKSRVGQEVNIMVAARKQPSWEQTVRELLVSRVDVAAPSDASLMGMVVDKLHEFLVLRERASEKEDLLRGLPVQDDQQVLFRLSDFRRYLQGFKLDKVEGSDLFLTLQKQGATHRHIMLSGRLTEIWSYPVGKIHEQKEDFKPADFHKDFEEV